MTHADEVSCVLARCLLHGIYVAPGITSAASRAVLRDLAAPDFQARNIDADLGQTFSDLRHRNFDLYGAALLAPQFTVVPALDQSGMLHLAGYIPTRPQQINFDLLFQAVGNRVGDDKAWFGGFPAVTRRCRKVGNARFGQHADGRCRLFVIDDQSGLTSSTM